MLDSLLSFDGGLTLLAPFVAIALALATKRILPSLGLAAVAGALVATDLDPIDAFVLLLGIVRDVVWSGEHLTISGFSIAVAAMVGLLGRAGATRSLVKLVERVARGRRGAMTASWLGGGLVFFDDYANCLVVGSSMGPLCDRFRVSRAKLAYIVDATAAPIASLALVSTWVGYEVGQIGEALPPGSGVQPFELFLGALPYRFYCLFTIVFVGAIALSGRDFGPMWHAESRAINEPREPRKAKTSGASAPAWVAALPVLALVVGTFALLYQNGAASLGAAAADARLFEILGAVEDPYTPMLLGSLGALALALAFVLGARTLAPLAALDAMWDGGKAVLQALAVLYLAWTLGDVIDACGAGEFLKTLVAGRLPPALLPLLTFLLAALTAFSTGSSFFTMGALIPLVVPLAFALDGGAMGPVLLASTAAVLDGAVLGDHASPISDTTVLSALGSGVDVLTHVRTQLPYALTAGAVAVLVGSLPAGFGVTPWVLVPLGALACVGVVLVVGRPHTAAEPAQAA
ncbi:MAG: Na+/H+ antiporter NhaC [Myxococcota bacterium]|jgi:Na+/H+ antiporter NhaC